MTAFTVEQIARLHLARTSPLAEMYTLSPFVWHEQEQGPFELLLRAVNHAQIAAEKVARIYYGQSGDGLHFTMGDQPVLAPGPGDDDKDGCEDPTVAVVEGMTYVYYTGWNQTARTGQLLLAAGADGEHLRKCGIAIPSTERVMNPKEASIVPVADGRWRLFFEYAHHGASKVGIASASAVDGPWTVQPSLFEARPGRWDGWHLSPGPLLCSDPTRPVMFYNGATRDAAWRIGWIAFDAGFTRVVDRGDDPLITPPPGAPGDTDIAFAASAVVDHRPARPHGPRPRGAPAPGPGAAAAGGLYAGNPTRATTRPVRSDGTVASVKAAMIVLTRSHDVRLRCRRQARNSASVVASDCSA